MEGADLIFEIETVKLIGQQITFIVTWKIPERDVHVNDLIVLFKGDPWNSTRQLKWAYASAAAINDEVICSVWADDTCLEPGLSTKPWASITMEVDSAGDGKYSAVYFSYKKEIRMLANTWSCTLIGGRQIQDCTYANQDNTRRPELEEGRASPVPPEHSLTHMHPITAQNVLR
jgi:hypothetical protein